MSARERVVKGLRRAWSAVGLGPSPARVFADIHRRNSWGSDESVSGPGSTMAQTYAIRAALPALLAELGIRSMFDAPCGDFRWMSTLNLTVAYTGGDIVPELVERNNVEHGYPGCWFVPHDLTKDLVPTVDLVFVRDCLVHLSNADAARVLANIERSGSRWLLTTTFPAHAQNRDIATGQWRPVNLEASPFSLAPPERLISEACRGDFADKAMGLWRVASMRG